LLKKKEQELAAVKDFDKAHQVEEALRVSRTVRTSLWYLIFTKYGAKFLVTHAFAKSDFDALAYLGRWWM
jgi:hypothetical protein